MNVLKGPRYKGGKKKPPFLHLKRRKRGRHRHDFGKSLLLNRRRFPVQQPPTSNSTSLTSARLFVCLYLQVIPDPDSGPLSMSMKSPSPHPRLSRLPSFSSFYYGVRPPLRRLNERHGRSVTSSNSILSLLDYCVATGHCVSLSPLTTSWWHTSRSAMYEISSGIPCHLNLHAINNPYWHVSYFFFLYPVNRIENVVDRNSFTRRIS